MLSQSADCPENEDRLGLRGLDRHRIAIGRGSAAGPDQMGMERKVWRETEIIDGSGR